MTGLPRTLRLVAGWGAVALLVGHAGFRGGIALDVMFAIMKVVGLFGDAEVLAFEPDWLGMLHRSAAVLLAGYLAIVTLRYQRRTRGACERCGRTTERGEAAGAGQPAGAPHYHLGPAGASAAGPAGATGRRDASRRGRTRVPAWDMRVWSIRAAYAAAVPALAYAALKLQWGFGGTVGLTDPTVFAGVKPWSPGMGDTAVMAMVGVGVALAMAHGWPRLPRWVLLTPAVIGCLMLLPVGVLGTANVVVAGVTGTLAGQHGGLAPWVVGMIYPTFLLWGVLLAVVTIGYHHRTRRPCRRCGQGEQPGSLADAR